MFITKALTVAMTTLLYVVGTITMAYASSFTICKGSYALCAASPSTPTGNSITVKGTSYEEVMAVCPVMDGSFIADLTGGNMDGTCTNPNSNTVWSLFMPTLYIPQAPDWDTKTKAPIRLFTTTSGVGGQSNMFSFLCTMATKENGVQLANCYGPANESFNGTPVPVGTLVATQAVEGASLPVSTGPLP